jgi:hypothetical protein
MKSKFSIAIAMAVGLLAGGCDEGTTEPTSSGCQGGKCDANTGGDATLECPSDDELLEQARQAVQVVFDLEEDDFFSEGAHEIMEDLDGDGVEEHLVWTGSGGATANGDMVLFLSQGGGCADRVAGVFNGVGLSPSEDGKVTNGARDLEQAGKSSACEVSITNFSFDGEAYRANGQEETIDLCAEEECLGCEERFGNCQNSEADLEECIEVFAQCHTEATGAVVACAEGEACGECLDDDFSDEGLTAMSTCIITTMGPEAAVCNIPG